MAVLISFYLILISFSTKMSGIMFSEQVTISVSGAKQNASYVRRTQSSKILFLLDCVLRTYDDKPQSNSF